MIITTKEKLCFEIAAFENDYEDFYLNPEKIFQLCSQRNTEVCAELSECFDNIIKKHKIEKHKIDKHNIDKHKIEKHKID